MTNSRYSSRSEPAASSWANVSWRAACWNTHCAASECRRNAHAPARAAIPRSIRKGHDAVSRRVGSALVESVGGGAQRFLQSAVRHPGRVAAHAHALRRAHPVRCLRASAAGPSPGGGGLSTPGAVRRARSHRWLAVPELRHTARLHKHRCGARHRRYVLSAGGARHPPFARERRSRTGGCRANARRRSVRPVCVHHAAIDRSRHPGRHSHCLRGRPRRIRRGDYIRLQHSGRDPHLAAGAVYGAADTGRRHARREAGHHLAVAGARGSVGLRDAEPRDRSPPRPGPGALSLHVELRKRRGDFTLESAFSAPTPGVTAIFGRSGCGKSTLISRIAGLLTPDGGRVVVGDDVWHDSERHLSVDTRHRRMGVVFQDARLFPHLTVRANLEYGLRRLPKTAERPMKFDDVVSLLGLTTLITRRTHELSGGERQRVALGRALLAQPRLLLLDEPLASLDLARREEVLRYIELLRDDLHIPIVYVTHSVAEITRLADAVVLLSEGKAIAVGKVDEIMGRLDLRPQTGRYEAGAVIETTVAAQDLDYGLTTLRFSGGELIVPNVEALVGERVRVRIRARDVALAAARPASLSILNVLQASVVAIANDGGPIVEVQLKVGDVSLAARITRRSLTELGVSEGREIYALIKAVSIDRRSVGYA